jgi:hypothetical protein
MRAQGNGWLGSTFLMLLICYKVVKAMARMGHGQDMQCEQQAEIKQEKIPYKANERGRSLFDHWLNINLTK